MSGVPGIGAHPTWFKERGLGRKRLFGPCDIIDRVRVESPTADTLLAVKTRPGAGGDRHPGPADERLAPGCGTIASQGGTVPVAGHTAGHGHRLARLVEDELRAFAPVTCGRERESDGTASTWPQ